MLNKTDALKLVPLQFKRAFEDSIHRPIPTLDELYDEKEVRQFVVVMSKMKKDRGERTGSNKVDNLIDISNFRND